MNPMLWAFWALLYSEGHWELREPESLAEVAERQVGMGAWFHEAAEPVLSQLRPAEQGPYTDG